MPETTSPPRPAAEPSGSTTSKPSSPTAPKSPSPAAPKPSGPAVRKRRGWGWLKFLLWLLIISGLAGGGYWLGMQALERGVELVGQLRQQRAQLDEQRGQLNEQREQLQSLLDGEAERKAHLAKQLEAARALTVQQLEAFTEQIDALREAQRPGDHRLRLMAIEWLVLSAHTQNTLRLDPTLAAEALEIADQQLRALPAPQVAALRRTLAHVQAELITAAEFDLTGTSVELEVLGERVNGLTLPVRRLPAPAAPAPAPDETDLPFWRQMWRDLRSMVIIEPRTAEVDLLLLPELGQVLRQRIGLSLDFAQDALLRRDQDRFRAHLEALETLVGQHFASNPGTAAWIGQVRALKTRPIVPSAASFDALLDGLRQLRAELSR